MLPVQPVTQRRQLPRRQRPDPLGKQRVLPQPARHQLLSQPHHEDDVQVQPDGRAQRRHQHARAEPPLTRQVIGQLQAQGEPQRGQISHRLDHAEPRQPGHDPRHRLRCPGLPLRQLWLVPNITKQGTERNGGPPGQLRP